MAEQKGRVPSHIELRGVCTHNLKSLDIDIPHHALTVVTGVSGSGKSSLAFDTLYAEGQRRFVESMSTYARQFLQRMEKPPLRSIQHVLPALALRQKGASAHARSTVGTVTELDNHLQLLYAHLGQQMCPCCGEPVVRDTVPRVLERIRGLGEGAKLVFIAEVRRAPEEPAQHLLARLAEQGFRRMWVKDQILELESLDVETWLDAEIFPVLIDRIVLKDSVAARLVEAVQSGYDLGGGSLIVERLGKGRAVEERLVFEQAFRCHTCNLDFSPLIPALFNPNTTLGACPECTGFGRVAGVDRDKVIPNPMMTLEGGAVAPYRSRAGTRHRKEMMAFCKKEGIPTHVPWRALSRTQQNHVYKGHGSYSGIRGFFKHLETKRRKAHYRILLARYRGYTLCETCDGGRLSEQSRHVLVGGTPLHDIYEMNARDALAHFRNLELSELEREEGRVLLEEIELRLDYMVKVGLDYLLLKRQCRSLSGGEFQRLHLTSSIGRALTDTLYVLDEPTAGLHARDSLRLLSALEGLRDIGNTVVVVEHDPEIILGADWTLELGPMGGEGGGELLYAGPLEGLKRSDTPTGRMLSARTLTIPPRSPAKPKRHIEILGATENNLDGIDVRIPLGQLVCVSGVSGSGKSTLVQKVLYNGWRVQHGDSFVKRGKCSEIKGFEHLDDAVMMTQRTLGRSSRSNAATVTKAYDAIRKIMASTRLAKQEGITAGHFSFNSSGGRCEHCEGTGNVTIEMQFMADVTLTCEHCDGKRFSDRVLDVRYKSANIYDILQMTVDTARTFFASSKAVSKRLQPLIDVGLGYLRLGQTTSTLSGGELQRLKLASYLLNAGKSKSSRTTLYIFDEPTVGLHLADVEVLVRAIRRLVDEGASVLVVEHNVDFIAAADHVIDLGPEGGDRGGRVLVAGHPRDVASCGESHTAPFLAELFNTPQDDAPASSASPALAPSGPPPEVLAVHVSSPDPSASASR